MSRKIKKAENCAILYVLWEWFDSQFREVSQWLARSDFEKTRKDSKFNDVERTKQKKIPFHFQWEKNLNKDGKVRRMKESLSCL
jgi:hypothetical protein